MVEGEGGEGADVVGGDELNRYVGGEQMNQDAVHDVAQGQARDGVVSMKRTGRRIVAGSPIAWMCCSICHLLSQ
ncbi:hypothetical protein GCM10023317_25460 [Actinopolymorpha pittospori]